MSTKISWERAVQLDQQAYQYTCGHCGCTMASNLGYQGVIQGHYPEHFILICTFCYKPTYLDAKTRNQVPGSLFGASIEHITSPEVEALYNEARTCMTVNAHTAAIICCRKLLMNIAVSLGDDPNKTFAAYIDYLEKNNFIPANSKTWVDHIRKKGNEANHEIHILPKEDAEELLNFMEMILKLIYEFPGKMAAKTKAATATGP